MTDTSVKSLKNIRKNIKGQITRFKRYIDEYDPRDRDNTVVKLKIRLDKIESSWQEFNEVQTKIEEICIEKIESGDTTEEKQREIFENEYFDVVGRAREIIAETEDEERTANEAAAIQASVRLSTDAESAGRTVGQGTMQVKYPQINLPIFHGAYDEWLNFYDTFKSLIHNNVALSDIEKFHYLKSCLRSEAIQVVKSLEVSSSNYAIAWNLLKDRFQNKRLIINNHIKGLLEIPAISKESSAALRQLLDNTVTHLRALDSLEQPTSQWDTLIIYLVANKLDSSTRRSWESSIQKNHIPQLQDLIDFLTNRAQILESIYGCQGNIKNHKEPVNKGRSNSSYFASFKPKCPHCKNQHFIYQCEDFLKLSISERIQKVKQMKLCLNCLRENHTTEDCRSSKCKRCNSNHNTLLHSESNTTVATLASHACRQTIKQILLSTAIVYIQGNDGKQHKCRALLDSGSHLNFITNDLCNRLRLTKTNISEIVTGINQESIQIGQRTKTSIKSQFNGFTAKLDFFILSNITENLPSHDIDTRHWKIPKNIKLADPEYNISTPVDILIGAEIFWSLFCIGQISLGKDMPVIQKTKLGWILAGPIGLSIKNKLTCNFSLQTLNSRIEQLWELENQATENKNTFLSPEEQFCERHYMENTTRSGDGKFIVKLPLKKSREALGDSKNNALRRFYSLEKRLEKTPAIKQQYHDFMEEYISLGHMRETTEDDETPKTTFYLPHHAVVKADSATTKLRVVFDASAKSDSGLSLNDIMMVGPTLQPDLFTILIRFRMYKIAITADVEKMYRMIKVHVDDVNLQRILWRHDPSEPIKSYNLLTVTYGTAAASFLSTRCLLKIADNISITQPNISKIIKESFYVDDLLTGFNSEQEAIDTQRELQTTLQSFGFNLRKWCSNSPKVTHNSPVGKDEHQVIDLNKQDTIKTLGLVWNPKQDFFQYMVKDDIRKITKRSILSSISSIFDPLGLLAPVTIVSKIILQRVWQERLDWDEVLPMNLHTMWERYKRGLHLLNHLKINRYVTFKPNANDFEIHGFADASEQAYGACIYIRSTNHTNLLCSKTRVAPLKQISIPRLELCAAQLLAQLYTKIVTILQIRHTTYLWTDSTIVLAWLKGSPSQWQTFVANRVSQVQELTNIDDWRHIRSQENPADMLTRGIPPEQIHAASLWWHGPHWLEDDPKTWPINENEPEEIPEQRKRTIVTNVAIIETSLLSRYSSLLKLQRVTAYILRFIHNCKSSSLNRNTGLIEVVELSNAMNILLKMAQQETFPSELKSLNSNGQVKGKSKLFSLNPFLDKEGLIRLGGRLKHANIDFENKYPIILDPNHALTKLIILDEHSKLMHAGCQHTLASLRTRYWPLAGKNAVKRNIKNCITCFKSKPNQANYIMADLPAERVTPTRPFLACGVDYAGPFYIKEGNYRSRRLIKTYLCIFVCLSTKATHLELAKDLSTEAFINCLRRFVSRRGKCHTIFSDNATNFVGARNQLKELGELLANNEEAISNVLSQQFIQWKMIPPRAPHFGGLWEAAVKSAKYHLTRVVGTANLTYEELYTIIIQVESCLNSRPISPLSNDPNDFNPLTPAHFLLRDSLQPIAQSICNTDNFRLMSRYQRQQQVVKNFWDRWHKDYLQNLQQRPKWKHHQPNAVQVGHLVVLREDNLPPLRWQLGRITQLHPGADGVVRVVTVKVGESEIKRPVKKVCVLPIEH